MSDIWGAKMCRYKYGKDKCAHPRNFTIGCIGEESCNFLVNNDAIRDESMGISKGEEQSEEQDRCPNTKCGIYCEKYNRFYCAGEDNCQTEDKYLNHMNLYGYMP